MLQAFMEIDILQVVLGEAKILGIAIYLAAASQYMLL